MSFYVYITSDAASLNGVLALLATRLAPGALGAFLSNVVDPFIRQRIESRFAGEGDDVTGRWHPLTVATELYRSSKGYSPAHPINQRTHDMHDYLVNTPGDVRVNGPTVVLTHPPTGGSYGLTDLKIETAQRGKATPRTPARPVIGVNQNDLLFVTSELTAYLIA